MDNIFCVNETFTSEIVNRKMSIIKLSERKNCLVFIFGGTSHKLQFRFEEAKKLFYQALNESVMDLCG